MFKQFGASVPEQALAVPAEPAHGLVPSGFDPSRVTVESFAAWVSRQQPSEEYRYFDVFGCALCLFLKDHGIASPAVGGDYWRDRDAEARQEYPLPAALEGALARRPHTFGALAARLAEQASA